MTPADREFLAGWSFGAGVIALHLQAADGRSNARGGITMAVKASPSASPELAGETEAYLAAWGF